jgi:SAM-dependent methyltransferase
MYKSLYLKYKRKYLNLKETAEYQKYSGSFSWTDTIKRLKKFHRKVKEYYIKKYAKNTLIDIGSGRGLDVYVWIAANIKFVVGIEPSVDSIKQAIIRYKQVRNNNTKVMYLNGTGDELFSTGAAALRESDRDRFKHLIKVDTVDLFFTIHYMLNNKQSFDNLLENLHMITKPGSTIIVLCMDGRKIDSYLKQNNGIYEVKKDDTIVFKLEAKYDYKSTDPDFYGNKISVHLASTYGLEKGIDENLVLPDILIDKFKERDINLISQIEFLNLPIDEKNNLRDYERKISALYLALVFKV